MDQARLDTSWYEFACAYVDMKWKQAWAKYRKDIARVLIAATPAMHPFRWPSATYERTVQRLRRPGREPRPA